MSMMGSGGYSPGDGATEAPLEGIEEDESVATGTEWSSRRLHHMIVREPLLIVESGRPSPSLPVRPGYCSVVSVRR